MINVKQVFYVNFSDVLFVGLINRRLHGFQFGGIHARGKTILQIAKHCDVVKFM